MKTDFSETELYVLNDLEKSAQIYREIDAACNLAVQKIDECIGQFFQDIKCEGLPIERDSEYSLIENDLVSFVVLWSKKNNSCIELGVTLDNDGSDGYSDFSLLGVGDESATECAVYLNLKGVKDGFTDGKKVVVNFEERELAKLAAVGFQRPGQKGNGFYFKTFQLDHKLLKVAINEDRWSDYLLPIFSAIESLVKTVDWNSLEMEFRKLK